MNQKDYRWIRDRISYNSKKATEIRQKLIRSMFLWPGMMEGDSNTMPGREQKTRSGGGQKTRSGRGQQTRPGGELKTRQDTKPAADLTDHSLKKKEETAKRLEAAGRDALNPERYTAALLSEEDLTTIIGMYGNSVEDIYALGPGQEWMMERGKHVKNAFFLQILTKAEIQLNPAAFRQQADKVCEKHESLRSAFVYSNVSKHYRVVLKDRHPEINYFDLSGLAPEEFDQKVENFMAADRMRGFDLERDSLLRINVLKSCEKDTYALIVSQPHINSDGTSLNMLFADLFIGYALDMNGIDKRIEAQSYHAYAEHLQHVDVGRELEWWKQYLKDAEEDQLLPGQSKSSLDYASEASFVPFSEEDTKALVNAQKTLKASQFTILQSLWGIMTARLKGRSSIVFGAITSGRDAEVTDSMTQTGGFVNVLPVRITWQENETFCSLIGRVRKDFAKSISCSHCSPIQIQEALNRETPVFGHILNYHNFAKPKAVKDGGDAHIPGIRLLGGETYDNLSEDLCVYFTVRNGMPGAYYSYNGRAFSKETIELLGEFFQSMIFSLKDITPETRITELPSPDISLIYAALDAGRMNREKIAGFMKKHPVFQSAADDELLVLAEAGRLDRVPEDYIIVNLNEASEEIPILVQGRAILFRTSSGGWSNPVHVYKPGDFLSMAALFEDEKRRDLLITDAGAAVILWIRSEALLSFLDTHPDSWRQIAYILEKEKQNYLRLWLNAT